MGRGKPPLTLADWKGIRIRAPGGLGEAMRRIGAVPTSMESTEVYTSLERGTIDAAALPSTVSFAAFRIQEVTKWITENLELGSGAGPLIANAEALAKLPPQYAALLDEMRTAAYADFKTQFKETDEKNLPAWKAKGIQFIRYDEATLARFRDEAGKPVWDEWIARQTAAGLPARELLDLVVKTAAGGS
jgi:TRAP-type C4-dicarboxylate transport system substrate-binding protein